MEISCFFYLWKQLPTLHLLYVVNKTYLKVHFFANLNQFTDAMVWNSAENWKNDGKFCTRVDLFDLIITPWNALNQSYSALIFFLAEKTSKIGKKGLQVSSVSLGLYLAYFPNKDANLEFFSK